MIPHRCTNSAWCRLASEFEMGSGACDYSMVLSGCCCHSREYKYYIFLTNRTWFSITTLQLNLVLWNLALFHTTEQASQWMMISQPNTSTNTTQVIFHFLTWFCDIIPSESPLWLFHTTKQVQHSSFYSSKPYVHSRFTPLHNHVLAPVVRYSSSRRW